jgi:hypothetical protein
VRTLAVVRCHVQLLDCSAVQCLAAKRVRCLLLLLRTV